MFLALGSDAYAGREEYVFLSGRIISANEPQPRDVRKEYSGVGCMPKYLVSQKFKLAAQHSARITHAASPLAG